MKLVEKRGKHFVPTKNGKDISLAPHNVYDLAKDKVKFWENISNEIDWIKPWKTSYKKEKGIHFSWFKDGKLNLCYNAVDRNLESPDKSAIIFVPENTKEKKQEISYSQLFGMVNKAAGKLIKLGVKKGDVVAIYMPMTPEALISMLACVRIGAIHSVVFSAFSPDALRTRIKDGRAKVLITGDYYYRKGKKVNLKKEADEACKGIRIKKIVHSRKKAGKIYSGKFDYVKPVAMDGEDVAFILYTSGTTGKPKGVMHATGGYTVQAYCSCKYIFNLQPNEVMWCTADIGWITGHTYATYGPLLNGATSIVFEGLPNYPRADRFMQVIEQNNVTAFYTAPTALRMFALSGTKFARKHKMNSLKVLGSVGEPIDEAAWMWFFKNIGKSQCPVIDTYWQTETGSAVISALPGIGPFVPTYAGRSFPGMDYDVVNEKGKYLKKGKKGLLVQKPPFNPALIRGVWGDLKRYKKYFEHGNYLAGDNAFKLGSGEIRILGRSDDIIKVAGHRLSTAEIENVIAKMKGVVEVAVVSKEDKLRGEIPVAFVETKSKVSEKEIISEVTKKIGPIAKPKEVYFVKDIPKTRSGKMMRRILKTLLKGEETKNTSTMVNPDAVKEVELVLKNKQKLNKN
jgi:acetyl-CoA synthetase